MRAWITKYALTDGIKEVEGEISEIGNGRMFCVSKRSGGISVAFHGEDWHRSLEAALNRADKMRSKKIASLRKQIAKLETMTW